MFIEENGISVLLYIHHSECSECWTCRTIYCSWKYTMKHWLACIKSIQFPHALPRNLRSSDSGPPHQPAILRGQSLQYGSPHSLERSPCGDLQHPHAWRLQKGPQVCQGLWPQIYLFCLSNCSSDCLLLCLFLLLFFLKRPWVSWKALYKSKLLLIHHWNGKNLSYNTD